MNIQNSRFKTDETGVYFVGNGPHDDDLFICSPLTVEAETRDENNRNCGRLLRWKDKEGVEHTWVMPISMLAGESTAVREKLMDEGHIIASNRKARDLHINTSEPAHRRIRCCSQLGWYGNSAFILPDQTFAIPGTDETRFQTTSLVGFDAITVKGTLEEWQSSIGKWAVGNSRLAFAISLGFAGPLLDLANEQGGGFNLVGSSGDGKTTTARACVSVMGSPKMLRTWRVTANGLEGVAWSHNHLTLCLDELAQVSAADASTVAYMLANGEGKIRATQTGAARPSSRWLLLFLSTGEITLADHASSAGMQLKAGAEVRCLNIAADAGAGHRAFETLHGAVDGAMLSQWITDAAEEQFGHPLRQFLSWLVSKRDEVQKNLRPYIESFVDRNASFASGEVRRAAKRFALVGAAGELATEAGVTGWPEGEAIRAAERCFQSYLDLRGSIGESDTEKAIRNVFAFIEKHGASRFQILDRSSDQRVINRAGFWRQSADGSDEYLFLPDVFRDEVCKGANYVKVAHELIARKRLVCDRERLTKKVRLPGLGCVSVYAVICPEEIQLADAA